MGLKLHDAQSCLAREYGFPSWTNLKNDVDLRNDVLLNNPANAIPVWLNVVYGHHYDRPQPEHAVKILEEHPELIQGDFLLSCAVGDDAVVRRPSPPTQPSCTGRSTRGSVPAATGSAMPCRRWSRSRIRPAPSRAIPRRSAPDCEGAARRGRRPEPVHAHGGGRAAERAVRRRRQEPRRCRLRACCWTPAPTRTTTSRCTTPERRGT